VIKKIMAGELEMPSCVRGYHINFTDQPGVLGVILANPVGLGSPPLLSR
jgi:hypothetical protein